MKRNDFKGSIAMNRTETFGLFLLAFVAVMLIPAVQDVYAITAPATGTPAYDVYDLAVNKFLKGAIGFSVASGMIGYAGFKALQNDVFGAIGSGIGGGILLGAPSIVGSLGALI
ncbi:MAG: hypothetical protein OEY64_03705 [Nitrospinota bacterium]|nr:hypothetical protein [Nitrospinota bacterium]